MRFRWTIATCSDYDSSDYYYGTGEAKEGVVEWRWSFERGVGVGFPL